MITDDIRRVIGSNMQLEPRHIFTNTLPPRAGLNEHDPNRPARRVRLGIIPDALLRNVFLPTTTHSNVPLDVLVDFKTIVRCRSRYSDAALRTGRVSRATRNRRRGQTRDRKPVDVRAEEVAREYFARARSLDREHNGTAEGDVGPVEAALRQYTGGYGAVGLVFGAYGECSAGVVELMQMLAKKLAENWRQMGAVSKEVAYSYALRRLRERWGLTALREMARLRLRRLSAVGRPAGARPEERVADALLGGGVGSAADFNASGADGGGGSGPHGRDAGRISLPSDSYA